MIVPVLQFVAGFALGWVMYDGVKALTKKRTKSKYYAKRAKLAKREIKKES